jgi:hypothetical protein
MLELTESGSTHTWKKSACDSVRFAAKWTKTQLRTAEISIPEREENTGKKLVSEKKCWKNTGTSKHKITGKPRIQYQP